MKFRPFDKLNMFNLFGLRRKDKTSEKMATLNGNVVAKNGKMVKAMFDFVERII